MGWPSKNCLYSEEEVTGSQMPMEAGTDYRLSAFSSQKRLKAHGCLSSGGLLLGVGQGERQKLRSRTLKDQK
jgi:hypothetical protein